MSDAAVRFAPPPVGHDRYVNTRLVLRYDCVEHWEQSKIQLFPGEVAVSYETDPVTGEKHHYKLKVGERAPNGNLRTWKDLDYVTVDSVDISALNHEEVKQILSSYFVTKEEFPVSVDSRIDQFLSANISAYITTDTIPIGTKTWTLDCGNSRYPDIDLT